MYALNDKIPMYSNTSVYGYKNKDYVRDKINDGFLPYVFTYIHVII